MDEYGNGRVIKPPLEAIGYGKVFKPSSALRNKYWFIAIVSVLSVYVITAGTFFGIFYLIYMFNNDLWQYAAWFNALWAPVNMWFWIIALAILVPAFIIIPMYLNRFLYSVRGESGESLPEIYVRKGIVDITEKHVPLRAITNIACRTGPFDRLFGIGNVEIHTAGYSGGPYEGGKPEEKIEGIVFHQELRDFILSEMRKLKGSYAMTTEVLTAQDGSVEELTLATLQDMRELLRRMNDRLDRGGV
ncbi:MAG: PH domain-containing protein [Candidatus Thorarchaeota archaeon]|jgi:membrane protein YdbS with pleckstrin-like domain